MSVLDVALQSNFVLLAVRDQDIRVQGHIGKHQFCYQGAVNRYAANNFREITPEIK